MDDIKRSFSNAQYQSKKAFDNLFSGFGQGGGNVSFLNSNTLVAKTAFLILIIIGFVLLLRLGTMILTWLFSPTRSPKIVDGMRDGKSLLSKPGDPNAKGGIPILRSVNQRDGIEFTWSVWIFIKGLEYKAGSRKHIFSKGNNDIDRETNMMTPNNAPGLYIANNTNSLVVVMNTYNMINEEIIVEDIPLNKWVNIMIRDEGKILDVYVNGMIAVRHRLSGVPKQNYGDVLVTANGGFDGNLSDLWYFDYALNTSEIMTIVENGPNMTVTPPSDYPLPHYFALRWYFNNNKN